MKRLALGAVLFLALTLPSLVHAELVPGSAGAKDALLAVGTDGLPRVAFVATDGSIVLAVRTGDGSWAEQTVPAPTGSQALIGLELAPAGAALLIEATDGSRLSLAEQRTAGWRVRTIATAPRAGALGLGGLALRNGRPVVAYASLVQTRQTFLRLVQEDASGRLVGEAVTRKGFPLSSELPTVTPVVLPSGAVRIVEAFSGATIEWSRTKSRKDWAGQFLYANALAMPGGVVRAAADPAGGVWSSWTELFPAQAESHVVLTQHFNGEHTTILSTHAFLVALAFAAGGPEVAVDDYVDLEGARTVYAGLVLDTHGHVVELAGNLEGYAIDPSGARNYLLVDATGSEWYQSPTPPTARVELSAAVGAVALSLSGRVTGGASGGTVEIWRETQTGSELVTTLPLAADGTFALTDTPPLRPLTYRAVYRDTNGLPVSSLVRGVLGG